MAKVNTRIQSKHDVEKNWANATFAPLPGEIIIYDKDKGVDGGKHEMPRIKVGDGVTPVGSLPFVVDMEETNRAIDLVDADVQTAIKNVTANGTSLTFTKVDGSTVSVNTQDTNTDTMVTNTKANTTKAYITGTTSASTKTSTQVFDSTVYLDTEEGKLVAKKFQGKAMQDDLGNTISTTYETKADAAEAYEDLRKERRDALANMNKEAYLTWGGKNIDGSVGPVGASLSAEHSANRLAYLNPAALSFETSNNSGSTWSSMSMSNADKIKLVTTSTNALKVGTANPVTAGNRTRMTLTAATSSTTYVYTRPKKLLLDVSSPHGIKVLVEYKTGVSSSSWHTVTDCTISGWSAWNEIDLSALSTLGGSPTQTGNIWYLRLTFYVIDAASINSNYASSLPYIPSIRLFGDTCWTETSNLGKTGHLYSYDESQNATFPAKVTATQFVGPLQGNAATATSATSATKATSDGNGNNIVNTYATKTALAIEAEPKHVLTGSLAEKCSPVSLTLSELTANASNIALKVLPVQDTIDGNGYLWKLEPSTSTALTIAPYSVFNRPWGSYASTLSNNVKYAWLGTEGFELDADNDWYSDLTCYSSAFQTTNGALEKTSNGSDTYFMYGMFYSSSANTVYLCRLGCFFNVSAGSRMSFYFDSDLGTLYIEGPDSTSSELDKKQMYKHLPEDLYLFTIGYYSETDMVSSASTLGLKASCNIYDFNYTLLNLNGVPVNSSGILETAGTHLIRFPERGSVGGIVGIISGTAVNYEISYLHESGPETALQFVKECDTENFTNEFNKVISSGRADPDSNTPGLLYFKYL